MTLRALGNGVQYGYDDATGKMHIVQTGAGGVTDLGVIVAPPASLSLRGAELAVVEPAPAPAPVATLAKVELVQPTIERPAPARGWVRRLFGR